MGYLLGIILEGLQKFSGEIIAAALVTLTLWRFPKLRLLFTKFRSNSKSNAEAEVRRQINIHKREKKRLEKELRRKQELERRVEALEFEKQRLHIQRIQRLKAEAKRYFFIIVAVFVIFAVIWMIFSGFGSSGAKAQYESGLKYYNAKNYGEAAKYFRKSAEQGYAAAQFYLGVMYDNGRGVKQDYSEAMRLYRLAAEQGLAPAQYNLGFMYEYGYGISEDTDDARKWYEKAADQGDTNAQTALKRLGDKKPWWKIW